MGLNSAFKGLNILGNRKLKINFETCISLVSPVLFKNNAKLIKIIF